MNIYVGNLSTTTTEEDLKKAFETFGQLTSVAVIKDKYSNESKGFGFVEMASKDEALAAIAELNGKDLKGKALTVNEAKPRSDNRGGGGNRGRGGYGGGGGRRSF